MKTKETIAIIGATGNMGSSIARSLSKDNYKLILMSKNTKKLNELASSLSTAEPKASINANDCARDVSWEADVIIVATPYDAEKQVAERIREVATGKIVISISNPLNETFDDLVTDPDTSAAEKLQMLLPDSKVIKAFNTTFAADFSSPVIDEKKADAFIAGNDSHALNVVSRIVSSAGFNPVVAGDLTVSRTLERMQLKLIQIGLKNNYNWYAGWKILHN
jgi:NADPH-dependent F420 reductase